MTSDLKDIIARLYKRAEREEIENTDILISLTDLFALLTAAEQAQALQEQLEVWAKRLSDERDRADNNQADLDDAREQLSAAREAVRAEVFDAWRQIYGYLGALAMEGRPEAARLANSVDAAIKSALKAAGIAEAKP